jgi:hypothetical protein
MFHQALQRADELDAHLERTGEPIGPLHGLPISLKDAFQVKGGWRGVGGVRWQEGGCSEKIGWMENGGE